MSVLIKQEIKKIIDYANKQGEKFSEEKAFDILTCSLLCYNSIDYDKHWYDLNNQNFTDGPNDGGIDFVFFDDENSKVIIGQNKYSENCNVDSASAEIEKINHTLKNFKISKTSNYSKELKERFLNVRDRLNEENEGNIEIFFSTLSNFNTNKVESRVEGDSEYADLTFFGEKDLETIIEQLQSELDVVNEFKFDIDQSKNILEYKSNNYDGIVVNISANSLKKAFDKFESKGLFNLNIRRYIRAKNVDEGIIYSINRTRDDFWFKNNGLTIACKDYYVDGNAVKIYDFSIVNGGQTTTLIAKHLNSVDEDFYVMTKIVKSVEELDGVHTMKFFNEIAEATNSQKPIQPRDLKSNAPEMLQLQRLFEDRGYFLEIKRGLSAPRSYGDKKIKNEVLAQLIYSFVYQKPGTSRSNKRSLFSNNKNYKQIFHQNYATSPEKMDFLIDLVELNKRIDLACSKYNKKEIKPMLKPNRLIVLNNSKLKIVALMGFIYQVVNGDFDMENDNLDTGLGDFEYGSFISNYKEDNIDKLVEQLIFELTNRITEYYEAEFNKENVTSISNFLKRDNNYLEKILTNYYFHLAERARWEDLVDYYGRLFLRG